MTPNAPPASADNFRNVAARLALDNGWFLTDQFRNPANVRVHEETTAVEILEPDERTRRRVSSSAPARAGTISGVGRRLKAALPSVVIVLADPVGSALCRLGGNRQGREPMARTSSRASAQANRRKNLHRDVIDPRRARQRRRKFRDGETPHSRGRHARRRLRGHPCRRCAARGGAAMISTVRSSPCCRIHGIATARNPWMTKPVAEASAHRAPCRSRSPNQS